MLVCMPAPGGLPPSAEGPGEGAIALGHRHRREACMGGGWGGIDRVVWITCCLIVGRQLEVSLCLPTIKQNLIRHLGDSNDDFSWPLEA